VLGTQLPGHRPENARADRLVLLVQQHRRVLVEADHRTVRPPHALARTYHHGVHHLPLAHPPAGDRLLHGDLDDVTDARVPAPGAAQHLDALHPPGAAVVGDVQHGFRLNHRLDLTGAFVDALQHPGFGFRQRPTLHHGDLVAHVALVVLVVRVDLRRAADDLAVHRMLHTALDQHRDGLVH